MRYMATVALLSVVTIGSFGCDPAKQEETKRDIPAPFCIEHADHDTVGCEVAWVENYNDWMWVSSDGKPVAHLSGLPEVFEKDTCKSCKYWMKLTLDKREAKSVPPVRHVIEVLDFKRVQPCKAHAKSC